MRKEKLEKQVCSLELSKQLKELKVKQESIWYWNFNHTILEWEIIDINESFKQNPKTFKNEIISAYTVAELGKKIIKLLKKGEL